MLWNRVLTKDEIKNLVNETPKENLQLHYEFENGEPKTYLKIITMEYHI